MKTLFPVAFTLPPVVVVRPLPPPPNTDAVRTTRVTYITRGAK